MLVGTIALCMLASPPADQRERMVRSQIEARGVKDTRILEAMRQVPRHELVPLEERAHAYDDTPLPIGYDQTISQPYIVAKMTELLAPKSTDVVLEIGTGSGYQAAVLAKLVKHVYTIEIVPELASRARNDLKRLGFTNVTVIHGDGYAGLPRQAPFDGIIVTAAPERIPPKLIEQLGLGARLVIPVGPPFDQKLRVVEKTKDGIVDREIFDVRFVRMTGEAER